MIKFLKIYATWLLAVSLLTATFAFGAWIISGSPWWAKLIVLLGVTAFPASVHWFLTHPYHEVELFNHE